MASGLLGLATAFVEAWATEACAAAARLGLLPATTSPRAAAEEAAASSPACESAARGVLRADACADLAAVGPRTASTGRGGRRRHLSSPRRGASAPTQHGIPVEAAWQAACCLADALNEALLLRGEAEHARQLAEEWQRYAEETAAERDELLEWGLRVLDDNNQLRHTARSSAEEADRWYQDAKILDDCRTDLTGQLEACRQQADADALAAQAAASRLRSDLAGAHWLLRAANSRMGDLQAQVASQDHQLRALRLEVAAFRATLEACHSPVALAMASGLLGLATAFVEAWATEACAAAARLGLLPATTSPRAAAEEAAASSPACESAARGVLRAEACADLAAVGPRKASTGRRGRRRHLSSPRRGASAPTQHGIPVEAAWQAACCLADALNDALLLRREAEHAAQLAEDWQRYAEETAVERDELLEWGLRVLDDNQQLRHTACSSTEEAERWYQDAKILDDCRIDLTGQLEACRQQAQAEASRLRSDVAGAQWLLRVADNRMRDLQAQVASQHDQLQAMQREVAALRATQGTCDSPVALSDCYPLRRRASFMASGLLGLATAFVAAWATEACAAATRLGLLPPTTSRRAAAEVAMPASPACESEARGVLRTDACVELAAVGPRTASTGRRGRRRQLSSPRRATCAASEHGISVEAAWQAACCLADALNEALLLRGEAEHAAQLAEDSAEEADRRYQDAKILDDGCIDLTGQLAACRQQAQAEASRLRSDLAGAQWLLRAADSRMRDLQAQVASQDHQLLEMHLEVAALKATLGTCHSPLSPVVLLHARAVSRKAFL
eukprot:SM000127S26657  [mRNA]  locus=s127:285287:296846:+ [translate_table: standard]